MNRFKEELKNNNFVCSECSKCKKIVWPPSDYCNRCFGNAIWKPVSRNAVLLEYSSKEGEYFCLAEFEGQIRVIGRISGRPKLEVGQKLVLEKCDYDDSERFTFKIAE